MKSASLFLLVAALSFPASAAPAPYLHVDAAAQRVLRNKLALPPLGVNQPADIVLGTRGDEVVVLKSEIVAQRPVFTGDGTNCVLRFDGTDDFLALSGPRKLTPAATIFVLAAPKANPGYFRGFIASSEWGKNDYTNGLNLDLGADPSKDLSVINVESAGSQGARNLMTPGFFNATQRPFGSFHVFCVRSQIKPKGNEVWLDGQPLAPRDRLESNIGMDQIVIGARYYSNDAAQQPFVGSFINADIAEVLVFDTALSDADRQEIEQRLQAKTAGLNAFLHGHTGHSLEVLKDAPPVQMLVPGFTVSELPVKLTNRNNVRYRHDGKLVALGYDGTIHLLTDTDGDGLEDKGEVFWDKPTLRGPLGIALTKEGDPRGDGVFVPSKGKVSLILDKDRDGRADEEIIVATGWGEIMQSVDAVGIAIDPKDDSIYFGLGCTNFANAYLIDPATGKAGYDLKSPHGTIQKVSSDFKTRETVCTGVRFTCALGFNREGDLFATEQEGATWLPNGNPLDELLHILPGKHYGFPPRHPKHLPNVLDWPPIVEYGPQHQSTVGMCFNESVNGGPTLGPGFWAGDALVCGESRGKLYRTKLVKTPDGYVGQNQLIACLSQLTIDCVVSPQGDLVVACHTGPPDWGTGPKGDGHIYKIRYTGKTTPQPVWAWAAAPDEFRIAFDRDLKAEDWAGAKDKVRIEAGRYVSAGDRYEVIRPGYQVVRDQMAEPRRDVPVLGLSLTADRRTLVLRVPRQTEPVGYAVTLPLPESWRQKSPVAQKPEMDVLVTLSGLQITSPARPDTRDGSVPRTVVPHPYLLAAKAFTEGSAEHDDFFNSKLMMPEHLKHIHGWVEYFGSWRWRSPFVPAVQPGALLDWKQETSLEQTIFTGLDEESGAKMLIPQEKNAEFSPPLIPLSQPSGTRELGIPFDHMWKASYTYYDFDEVVPVRTSDVQLPWATTASPSAHKPAERILLGNWLAGRRLYFSSEAACFTCHQIRGEGIAVGPDLTNLISRDRESVLRDILQPSATINPDHPASTVKLKTGQSLTGIVRSANDKEVKIALQSGAVQVLNRADVAEMELLKTSFMPDDFPKRLTKLQQDDLLKFLLTNPLEPAPIERTDPPAPAPRKRSEVDAVLAAHKSPASDKPLPPLKILLCAGPKDHGIGEHDYPLWQKRWAPLLRLAENVTVDTAWEFPKPEQLAAADVTVFFSMNPGFNPRKAMLLDEYQERGGGLVYLHWAVNGGDDAPLLAERIGLASGKLGVKFRHGEYDIVFTQPGHPVTKGFPTLHFTDETYWSMQGDATRITVLGNGVEEGQPRPQLWSLERGKGRVIGCVPGHYNWTFDDPLFRVLVLRSICWTSRQANVDRLAELATVGARVVP